MKFLRNIKNRIKKTIVKFLLRLIRNYFQCYVINIENKNEHEKKAVIFGHHLFSYAENLGSDKGIEITTPLSTYEQIMYECQLHTKIYKIRVYGDNEDIRYRKFNFIEKTAFGRLTQIPIHLDYYFNEQQTQKQIIEVHTKFILHGSSYFQIKMKPKEKLTLVFFSKDYYEKQMKK
jgi:hypothetical protein